MSGFELIKQEKLTSESVRELILRSIDLIHETCDELDLSLFQRIEETGERLKNGVFRSTWF